MKINCTTYLTCKTNDYLIITFGTPNTRDDKVTTNLLIFGTHSCNIYANFMLNH